MNSALQSWRSYARLNVVFERHLKLGGLCVGGGCLTAPRGLCHLGGKPLLTVPWGGGTCTLQG